MGTDPWDCAVNPPGWTKRIFDVLQPGLGCPSDPNHKATTAGNNRPTSYRVSLGDWFEMPNHTQVIIKNSRGAFSHYSHHSRTMADFLDGTSNTIVFSEAIVGDKAGKKVKGSIATNIAFTAADNTDRADAELDECYNTNQGAKEYLAAVTDYNGDLFGRRWGDSAPAYTGFSTIFPPNKGPNCLRTTGESNDGIFAASSNHSGGVQAGLGDGSVRFISDTISCSSNGLASDYSSVTSGTVMKQSGTSNFGIWGAYGSINGGESVALP
jgi:hypothetical protein